MPILAAMTETVHEDPESVFDAPETVFDAVGGMSFFDALVDRFYARVELDAQLRALYPADLGPGRRALAMFLAQYWGGPPDYSAEKGHPRLRQRHGGFAIDVAMRDAWYAAMAAVLQEAGIDAEIEATMLDYFDRSATWMINRE